MLTLRSVMGPDYWKEMAGHLNFPFSATNTTILVLSSLTCQLGVFAAERGDVKKLRTWFIITFVMGSIFIGGQVLEYTELVKDAGLSLSSDPYGSVFYLTTGFHGLHVTGGLIAFLLVLGRTYAAKRFTHDQATASHRRVLLLALRGCGVDRPVRNDLHDQVTGLAPTHHRRRRS
ncbi:hypothetical protein SMICM304S_03766 [Streptomyces microflavus]